MKVIPATIGEIDRTGYISTLRIKTVDDRHEDLVARGQVYRVEEDGYAIVGGGARPTLMEFYARPDYAAALEAVIGLGVTVWRIRTDDAIAYTEARRRGLKMRAVTRIYLAERLVEMPQREDLTVRPLTASDLQAARAICRMESAQIRTPAPEGHFGAFRGGELVGVARYVPQPFAPYFTVEAVVAPSRRREGVGRLLLATVARHYQKADGIYIATVDVENEPARRLVESLGLVHAADVLAAHF